MNKHVIIFISISAIVSLAFSLFKLVIFWSIIQRTGIGSLAIVVGASYFFNVFIANFNGFIVDKFSNKKLIIICCILFAILSFLGIMLESYFILLFLVYMCFRGVSDLYSRLFLILISKQLDVNFFIKYNAIQNITTQIVAIFGSIISATLITLLNEEHLVIILVLIFSFALFICQKYLVESTIQGRVGDVQKKEKNRKHNVLLFIKENILLNKGIVAFIVILFILNLDYAYIPTIFPFFISEEFASSTPLIVGMLTSVIGFGEMFASGIVFFIGHRVSILLKIGLIGNSVIFFLFPFLIGSPIIIIALFVLYGFFDTLTQPFFSYFVSSIDEEKRGRILGIVDSIVYIAAPLGIFIGDFLSKQGIFTVSIGIAIIFLISLIIVILSRIYDSVDINQ